MDFLVESLLEDGGCLDDGPDVVLLRNTGFCLLSLDFLVISAPTFSGGSVPGSFLDFLDLFSLALFSLGGLEVSSPAEVGCGRDEPIVVCGLLGDRFLVPEEDVVVDGWSCNFGLKCNQV